MILQSFNNSTRSLSIVKWLSLVIYLRFDEDFQAIAVFSCQGENERDNNFSVLEKQKGKCLLKVSLGNSYDRSYIF